MTIWSRLRRFALGAPKDVRDPNAFHKLSLIAVLAWVGLGADGLSSSAYGPDEAFRQLGEHTGLAFFLALATALTVFIISYGYSRIIEQFPSGGGGYVVSTRLLGSKVGLVSGAALLVDYVLTITISVASGADAIFSFLPASLNSWAQSVLGSGGAAFYFRHFPIETVGYKLPFEFLILAILTLMNLRGVKESITILAPIFVVFLITHAIALTFAIGGSAGHAVEVTRAASANISDTVKLLGMFGALKLFVRAYSLGGGTYTGIEAVSNGLPLMREPRVQTAKRTMVLLAVSLAVTAGGILLAYLLVGARPEEGKTMNAVMLEAVTKSWNFGGIPFGPTFVVITLFSEGALLFVAAQTGFVDGPRVMANMATDSWLPHRFAALSDRLAMNNGVALMSAAGFFFLLYTGGDVGKLVVMYSINVFLTFSLSNLAMTVFWVRHRKEHSGDWWRHLPAHVIALILCATILVITILEKFTDGGWLTLVLTAALVAMCLTVQRHYRKVGIALRRLDGELPSPPEVDAPISAKTVAESDEPPQSMLDFSEDIKSHLVEHIAAGAPKEEDPVAILFVGGYSGLGRHAVMTLLRMFPAHFKGLVFVSIAVLDSESFKGGDQVASLEKRTRESLVRYERFANTFDLPAASAFKIGTEVPAEAETISRELIRRYPKALFVAGQLIFSEETLWTRVLHNETAFIVQKRLQHAGIPMIVLPVQIDLRETRALIGPSAMTPS
jgi:amino acid transporter